MQPSAATEFSHVQRQLDDTFHRSDDVYPRNGPDYVECVQFVEKLARLQASRQGGSTELPPPDNPAAEALGIPSSYDPRFRVNVAVVTDKRRMQAGVRAVQKKLSHASASSDASSAEQLVSQYSSLLPFYEDFVQRRQFNRLRKLLSDRAALPISPFEQQIIEAVGKSPVVVLAGDTGCGKSTQLPQFLLRAGYQRIVCTQPRRISAISLCRRVAFETLNVYGSAVAYKIRFASTTTGGSRIVFCTEGILLRMLAGDPQLSGVDVVIVDEVHERHLTTDFLLALLRALVLQRPALRVVLMSATINVQAYSDYFGGVPIIQVPGRLYPIQVEYIAPREAEPDPERRPGHTSSQPAQRRGGRGERGRGKSAGSQQDSIDPAPYLRLLQRIDSEVPSSQRGDLLVFVAGMADILALSDVLKPYAAETRRWIVLQLHSALSVEEQDKVFDAAPEGVRKCILSTNIAETSVTIDGVRFVADSGRAKELLHDLTSGGGSLQEGWISRASAEQRKGRAGRTGPGRCFRMYSQTQFEALRPFSLPEVQRVRLESVVLQIKALAGSGMNPRRFGFIDPPPDDALEAAIINLKQAGALSPREELTPLGAVLSLLPVDVHVGKLLVLGALLRLPDPVLTMAAALSVPSPFVRLSPEGEDEGVRGRRGELLSAHGDAVTLMTVFEAWLREKAGRGGGRRWCKAHGLQEHRLHEVAKLKQQFQELLRDVGLTGLGTEMQLSGDAEATEAGPPRKQRRLGRSRGARADRERLLDMQRARDRERGRRVLTLAEEEEEEEGESSGAEGGEADRPNPVLDGEAEEQELQDLELRLAVDVHAMAAAAEQPLSSGDVNLLKFMLAAALYPRVAVPHEQNSMRREQDARFHTSTTNDTVLHPASALAGSATSLGGRDVLLYCELLETHRLFLVGVTPVGALPALLLSASCVDTDLQGRRLLVDGWLLLKVQDEGGAGAEALVRAVLLRAALERLLARRLRQARPPAISAVPVDADSAAAFTPVRLGPDTGVVPELVQRITAQAGQQAGEAVDEEALAVGLASAMEWPLQYTLEQLSGPRVTAQYELPAADVQTSTKGAPKEKMGWKVAPWLTVGSLKSFESEMALHALQPALRRHWQCPGCSAGLIANAEDIQGHINTCSAAQMLAPEVLETAGYRQPQTAAPVTQDFITSGEAYVAQQKLEADDVRWGRRVAAVVTTRPPVEAKAEVQQPHHSETEAKIEEQQPSGGALSRPFTCSGCGLQDSLTPVQILQHRRSCVGRPAE